MVRCVCRIRVRLFRALMLVCAVVAQVHGAPIGRVPVFRHYTTEDGLSNNDVSEVVLQDRRGFLWFGSAAGVNRFDGYEFVVYPADDRDGNSLIDPLVQGMAEDAQGDIWVVTTLGVHRIDYTTGILHRVVYFEDCSIIPPGGRGNACAIGPDGATVWLGVGAGLYVLEPGMPLKKFSGSARGAAEIDTGEIGYILTGSRGSVWFNTGTAAIYEYDVADDRLTRWGLPVRVKEQQGFKHALEDTARGRIYFSTARGIECYDRATDSFTYHHFSANGRDSVGAEQAALDEDGLLWVATGQGLLHYDPDSGEYRAFHADPADNTSLSTSLTGGVFIDRSHVLWVTGGSSGLNCAYLRRKPFTWYHQRVDSSVTLGTASMWGMATDSSGRIWMGVWSKGVCTLEHQSGEPDKLRHLLYGYWDPPRGISGGLISTIETRQNGTVWVGAADGAISVYDPDRDTFSHIRPDHRAPESRLAKWSVWSILETRARRVWIGEQKVVELYDPATGAIVATHHSDPHPDSLSDGTVRCSLEEPDGTLWFGTTACLMKHEPESGRFTTYRHDRSDTTSLSNSAVTSLARDSKGRLWIGTEGGGLCRFVRETETFLRYDERDGLPDNVVVSIEEDAKGRLWLGTYKGIVRFDPETGTCRTYNGSDGLACTQFEMNSSTRGRDGRLYFGGVRGVTAFYPDSIRDDPYQPPVAITRLRVINEEVLPGDTVNGRIVLDTAITALDRLVLRHGDMMFSLEFAALQYAYPRRLRYTYQLEGFDRKPVHTGAGRRHATYTNLPAGTYTFRVKAANADGIWSHHEAVLGIRVLPPWWASWWFRILVALCTVAGSAGGYVWRTQSIRRRNRELEAEVARRTSSLVALADEITRSAEGLSTVSDGLTVDAGRTADRAQSMRDRAANGVTSIHQLEKSLRVLREAAVETDAAVQTIAESVKEMGATIGQVTVNCQRETNIVERARTMAATAKDHVESLQELVVRIGDIVGLIDDIAEQTNLLSLNAGIQAQKAGAAGRGFGVVASAIKELAAQTSDATQGINEQIATVRSAVADSAAEIVAIAETVGQIRTALQSILESVDRQSKATLRISGSVSSTTGAAGRMKELSEEGEQAIGNLTADMGVVDRAADDTLSSVNSTRSGIERMRAAVEALRELTAQVQGESAECGDRNST